MHGLDQSGLLARIMKGLQIIASPVKAEKSEEIKKKYCKN